MLIWLLIGGATIVVQGYGGLAFNLRVRWVLADRADSAAVAHVQDVHVLIDHEDDNGAAACLVMWLIWRRTDKLEEVFFCLVRALADGLGDVGWKFWLKDDIVVQVIFEILCALTASMAVVHTKDLQFGPFVSWDTRCLLSRLYNVENDRDPVLVCLSYDSDIGVCSEGLDHAKRLRRDLASLEERQRALRLVLLEELSHLLLDALRSHLSLSACSRYITFGLLGEHSGSHHNCECRPLPHVFHETCSAV